MTFVNAENDLFGNAVRTHNVTFRDEKNRSKLIKFLDSIGSYNSYDREMKLRVFVDDNNDFCAFEAVDYNLSFVNTTHKLVDMPTTWRVLEPISISQLRSMLAYAQY